jgi:2-keto-3-deoxy-L-fuconate dehydrogenase
MTSANAPLRFEGTRVLVTQADRYMGPAISYAFEKEGADVTRSVGADLTDPVEPQRIVDEAGRVDVAIINLSPDSMARQRAERVTDDLWLHMFDAMAHPTMRFARAVLPQMIERQEGKIVVVTSTAPIRPRSGLVAYSAARAAQNGYVRAAGHEVARHNVQINAVAQNYVYGGYPDDAMDDPIIREQVMREVPARRIAQGWEQAELVMFLASQASNFISGHVIPFSGGWTTSG